MARTHKQVIPIEKSRHKNAVPYKRSHNKKSERNYYVQSGYIREETRW